MLSMCKDSVFSGRSVTEVYVLNLFAGLNVLPFVYAVCITAK